MIGPLIENIIIKNKWILKLNLQLATAKNIPSLINWIPPKEMIKIIKERFDNDEKEIDNFLNDLLIICKSLEWKTINEHETVTLNIFKLRNELITSKKEKIEEKIIEEEENYQIFVKSLTGKTIGIKITNLNKTKVIDVMEKIKEQEAIPIDQQRLMFKNTRLHEDKTLSECGIEQNSTLHLVLRLHKNNNNL